MATTTKPDLDTPDINSAVPALGPESAVIWPPRTRHKLANGLEVVLVEIAHHSEIHRASSISAAEMPSPRSKRPALRKSRRRSFVRARPSAPAARSRKICAAWAPTSARAPARTPAPFLFPASRSISSELLDTGRRTGAASLVPRRGVRARAAADDRGFAHRAHHAVISRQRALAARYVWRAPVCHHRAHAKRRWKRTGTSSSPVITARSTAQATRCWSPSEIFPLPRCAARSSAFLVPGRPRKSRQPPNPRLPALRGRHVHFVHLPESVQTQVVLGNHAITRKHPDWLRLGLANSLYGGAFNSRLVMNIREAQGLHLQPAQRRARASAAWLFQRARGGAQRRRRGFAHRNVLRNGSHARPARRRRGARATRGVI